MHFFLKYQVQDVSRCSIAISAQVTSSYYRILGVQTMPEFAVSAFHYAEKHRGEAGSIWSNSKPGGHHYQKYWHPSLFGAFTLFPLDNYETLDIITFEKVGGEPIGYRMRKHLESQNKAYTELMIFRNYANSLDLYMHCSWWEEKTWALYKIDNISDPNLWHTATTIRYHSKCDFDREEMAIINEVNTDAVDEPIHPMTAKRARTDDVAMIANDETIPPVV